MKSNKGVTITSLSIYIVVSAVIFVALTFLNQNVISQIATLSTRSEKTNEMLKAQAFIISDIKAASRVLEYSDSYLKLDNGVEYNINYRANEKSDTEQTFYVYELYRNNVLITDEMATIKFEYDYSYDDINQEKKNAWVILDLYYEQNGNLFGTEQFIKVGRGI